VKCDAPTEFGVLVASTRIDASVVSVQGNALPVRTLQVAEVVFCSAPLIEPFPLPVDAVLLLAYVDPLHDTTDLQFLSTTTPASGLEGLATSPFDPLSCCHCSRYSLWIPSLLVEVHETES